jgi:hypothetical protein
MDIMNKPIILFIQGGGEGAYKEDKKLAKLLKDALKERYDVRFPRMPDEENPDYENYRSKIDEELKKIHNKVVLAGHSLGSCFLLKYLSENKVDKDIAGIFLLSTPFWGEGGWQYEGFELISDYPSKIPEGPPVFFYHGTDDEVVPFSHLGLYSKKFPAAVIREFAGRNHQLNNDLSVVVKDLRSLKI